MSIEFEAFRTIISNNKRFVLTTHVNPDGDGIGTETALAIYLQKQGKQVTILNYSAVPENYRFLEAIHPILWFDPARHAPIIENADVIIVLDTNHPNRLMAMKPFILASKAVKICIDHHLDSDDFADFYILDEEAAATGKIIYRLISYLTGRVIDRETAIALYTAIMTDTGSFRYPKTDPEIHKIAAHLIQMGADPVTIYEHVYERGPLNRIHMLGMTLANVQLACNGRVAYIIITRKMFEVTVTDEEDIEAFVPFTLSIAGVQIGLMFAELNDSVKISFRSKGDIWINELAKEFGGNGHKNAAGARIPQGNLDEIVPQVLEHASAYVD